MASHKQLTLFVTFHVKPSYLEEWKEAHRPVWAECAAEPECLFFDIFQSTEKSGEMRLVEVWNQSREWFETHQLTKPYYETLWQKSRPTWEKDPELEYFERLGEGTSYKDDFLTATT